MAISFVGVSAFQSGTGALTVPQPAGAIAGDLLILVVESANQAITTPTGYTVVTNSPQGTGTAAAIGAVRLSAFYKIHTGTEGSVAVADSGNHTTAVLAAYRGITTSIPIGGAAPVGSLQTTAGTFSAPSITTAFSNCMIVHAFATDTDATASNADVTTPVNANLTQLVRRMNQTTASGVGGGVGLVDGIKKTTGATGATTSSGNSAIRAYLTLALPPIIYAATKTTNAVRNSVMSGGVGGTPGTLPTGWSLIRNTSGLTYTTSYGVDAQGQPSVTFSFSGTTSGGGDLFISLCNTKTLYFDSATPLTLKYRIKTTGTLPLGFGFVGFYVYDALGANYAYGAGRETQSYATETEETLTYSSLISGSESYVPTISFDPSSSVAATFTVTLSQIRVSADATVYIPTYSVPSGLLEAGDSLAAAATATSPGPVASLSSTEAADTVAASGTVSLSATLARTDSADTGAASSTVSISATLARTDSLDTLTSSASATSPANATLAVTEASDTGSATGAVTQTVRTAVSVVANAVTNSAMFGATNGAFPSGWSCTPPSGITISAITYGTDSQGYPAVSFTTTGTPATNTFFEVWFVGGSNGTAAVAIPELAGAKVSLRAYGKVTGTTLPAQTYLATGYYTSGGAATSPAGSNFTAAFTSTETIAPFNNVSLPSNIGKLSFGARFYVNTGTSYSFTATLSRPQFATTGSFVSYVPTYGNIAYIAESSDTLSASGEVIAAPIQEASDTVAATGAVALAGTLARTDSPDTGASSGTVAVASTLAHTDSLDTLTSSGTVANVVTGTLSVTESADTSAALAGVLAGATLAVGESLDAGSGQAGVVVGTTLNRAEVADALSSAAPVGIAATSSVTEAGDTGASAGTLAVTARNSFANQFSNSSDLTAANWNNTTRATATLDVGPDGLPAFKITYTGVADPMIGQQALQGGWRLGGRTFTLQVEAWTDAGQSTDLTLFIYNSGITDVGQSLKTLTTTPTLYSFTKTFAAGTNETNFTARFDPRDAAGASGHVYLRYPQIREVGSAGTYVPTYGSAAGLVESGDSVSSAATLAVSATLATTDSGDTLTSSVTASFAAAVGTLAVTEAGDTGVSVGTLTVNGRNSSRNYYPNSTLQGVVTGSPGTAPTGWSYGAGSGVSSQILATGVDATTGSNYVDIRYSGTATATAYVEVSGYPGLNIPVLSGQNWVSSVYLALVGGSLPVTAGNRYAFTSTTMRSVVGTSVGGNSYDFAAAINSTLTRYQVSSTASASAAFVTPIIYRIGFNIGDAVDFTIRVAAPQVERGTVPSAILPTYGTPAGVEESGDTVAASGTVTVSATLAATDAADQITADAVSSSDATASLARTEAADTLSSSTGVAVTGTSAVAEVGDTGVSVGTLAVTGRSGSRNFVPNSTNQGAVVGVIGSGGAMPTGWTSPAYTGLTREVTVVTDDYFDLRIYGTNSSGALTYPGLYVNGASVVPGFPGQSFTISGYFGLVAGAAPVAGVGWQFDERNVAGSLLLQTRIASYTGGGAGYLASTVSKTISLAATVSVGSHVVAQMGIGETTDFTLRIGKVQIERGLSATAYLPTYGVAAGVEESGDTTTSTVTATVSASLSHVDSGDTLAGVAGVLTNVFATASVTEAGDTVSATAAIPVNATDATPEGADGLTAVSTVALAGTSSTTDAGDTVSAQVSAFIAAQLAAVDSGDTLVGKFDNDTFVLTGLQARRLFNIALLHGLVPGSPLTVTQTTRTAGDVQQSVTTATAGSISTVTVSTSAMAPTDWDVGKWVNDLAAIHGLTADLIVTPTSRTAGTIFQSMDNDGNDTVVERV